MSSSVIKSWEFGRSEAFLLKGGTDILILLKPNAHYLSLQCSLMNWSLQLKRCFFLGGVRGEGGGGEGGGKKRKRQ